MGKLLTVAMTEFVVEMSAEVAKTVDESDLRKILSLVEGGGDCGEVVKVQTGDWCSPLDIPETSKVLFAVGWDSLNRWGRGGLRDMPRMIYLSSPWHWKLRQSAPRWVATSVSGAPVRRSRSG